MVRIVEKSQNTTNNITDDTPISTTIWDIGKTIFSTIGTLFVRTVHNQVQQLERPSCMPLKAPQVSLRVAPLSLKVDSYSTHGLGQALFITIFVLSPIPFMAYAGFTNLSDAYYGVQHNQRMTTIKRINTAVRGTTEIATGILLCCIANGFRCQ